MALSRLVLYKTLCLKDVTKKTLNNLNIRSVETASGVINTHSLQQLHW